MSIYYTGVHGFYPGCSIFLFMQPLGNGGDGSNDCTSAVLVEDWIKFPDSGFGSIVPAVIEIWGVNQWMKILSLYF